MNKYLKKKNTTYVENKNVNAIVHFFAFCSEEMGCVCPYSYFPIRLYDHHHHHHSNNHCKINVLINIQFILELTCKSSTYSLSRSLGLPRLLPQPPRSETLKDKYLKNKLTSTLKKNCFCKVLFCMTRPLINIR